MGVFLSTCSKLCNEFLLMSVRRAEAELRWFKRNRESTGTMQESTGTGHTEDDHVLVTAILSAIFILVLLYLLVVGQPFRFRRFERAGTPSSAARSDSWVHGPSKTRLLPCFLSTVRYTAGSNNTVADMAWSTGTRSTSARNSETFAIFSWLAGPGRGAQPDWSFLLSMKKS